MKRLMYALMLLAAVTCGVAQAQLDPEEMYTKASALTKLTAAVQAFVRYDDPSDSLSEREILRLATKHDPDLLSGMSPYALKVRRQERNASVLMCTADGTQGLLEDVGCTAPLDKHLWQSPSAEPCTFTLRISEICRQ